MEITNDKLVSDRKQLQEIIKPGGVCGKCNRRGCLQHVHQASQHLTSYLQFIPYVTWIHVFMEFHSFCTKMNDSHLLQHFIYSPVFSARVCSAHAVLLSSRIKRQESRDSWLRKLLSGALPLLAFISLAMSVIPSGAALRGQALRVWGRQGAPPRTGLVAEGHSPRPALVAELPPVMMYPQLLVMILFCKCS